MTKGRVSLPLTVGLFLIMGTMVYLALGFNAEARRIPLVVGIPTVALLAVQVVRELLALRRPDEKDEDGVSVRSADQEFGQAASMAAISSAKAEVDGSTGAPSSVGATAMRASALQAFAWVLFLAVAFYFLGMLLAVPVFMGAFTRLYGREPWRVTILLVLGTVGVLHFFFVVLLGIRLYPGIVGPMIGL